MAISLPRILRISSAESLSKSRSLKSISPDSILRPRAKRPSTDRAERVLPEPLSPTTPTASPALIAKLTSFTKTLLSSEITTERFFISSKLLIRCSFVPDQGHRVDHRPPSSNPQRLR